MLTSSSDECDTATLITSTQFPPNSQNVPQNVAKSLSQRANPLQQSKLNFQGKRSQRGQTNDYQLDHTKQRFAPTVAATNRFLKKFGHTLKTDEATSLNTPTATSSSTSSSSCEKTTYVKGDAITTKIATKKKKGELTALERNRLMYDIDMNEAILAFDMNDIEPLTRRITTPPIRRKESPSSKDLPARRAAIRIATQKQKAADQRLSHGKQMKEFREKKQMERDGSYEVSKKIPFKQLKANRAAREVLAKEGKKALGMLPDSEADKGDMYVELLCKQLVMLDNFKNVHNVNNQPMPYELPKADESNLKFLIKNSKGKLVSDSRIYCVYVYSNNYLYLYYYITYVYCLLPIIIWKY